MSLKHSYTTADYLAWDSAMALIRKLYRDGYYRMSLLVGCGCFMGLRISDLTKLTWIQLLDNDELIIYEQKTGKRRVIKINKSFQDHIKECYKALNDPDYNQYCFINKFGAVISTQMINRHLKAIKVKYNLKVKNFSTHSLRKSWARQIYEQENAGGRGEMALLKLSELMNHSSPSITRKYIGLRQQELGELYNSLSF